VAKNNLNKIRRLIEIEVLRTRESSSALLYKTLKSRNFTYRVRLIPFSCFSLSSKKKKKLAKLVSGDTHGFKFIYQGYAFSEVVSL